MNDRAMIWHVGGSDVRMRIPLLERLRIYGFTVGAVGSEDEAPFRRAGIPYARYPLATGLDPLGDRRSVRALRKLVTAGRPQVVHAFDTKPGVLLPSAVSGLSGVRCLRTVTGMGDLFSRGDPSARLLQCVYAYAQRSANRRAWTVFQNCDDRQHFLRHGYVTPGRTRLVRGSGVDIVALRQQAAAAPVQALRQDLLGPNGTRVVLMVSRLVCNKGVDTYIAAARQAAVRWPHWHWVLVGPHDGGPQAVDRSLVEDAGAELRWLGSRQDAAALMAAADVVVLPTRYREGVPRVLLEAGALARPVVATDVPGCRDVVSDGVTGRLIPPRDPGALIDAVADVLGCDGVAETWGRAAQRRVETHFSLERVATDYAAIYTELLGQERRGRDAN